MVPSTNLLPPASVTINSTIYIGGMYEEDISDPSDSTPPYINYYNFGASW